ncbi:MAG TPA: 2-amino-4-hydroxy-6-hydroxymethyldihydropteridine diphosphokinase [Bacillus bacterium]|nr:2-amino-4-hydroxy-6-hydroxymethyldihydropteridine diphosphokinase [Bacillus sp. (in: firmicutes)]
MNNIAYISLGTNQGNRRRFLEVAINMLDGHQNIFISDFSSIYETEPIGYTEQPKFLNMVVKLKTSLTAFDLLAVTQNIENELGRTREIRWGPRTIDLDILLFNNENINSEQLIVPHPRMFERAFVMIPLLEINKELLSQYKLDVDSFQKDQGISLYIERK